MKTNDKMERFKQLLYRCKTREQMMRLWNWADCQPNPEPYMHLCYALSILRGF